MPPTTLGAAVLQLAGLRSSSTHDEPDRVKPRTSDSWRPKPAGIPATTRPEHHFPEKLQKKSESRLDKRFLGGA